MLVVLSFRCYTLFSTTIRFDYKYFLYVIMWVSILHCLRSHWGCWPPQHWIPFVFSNRQNRVILTANTLKNLRRDMEIFFGCKKPFKIVKKRKKTFLLRTFCFHTDGTFIRVGIKIHAKLFSYITHIYANNKIVFL